MKNIIIILGILVSLTLQSFGQQEIILTKYTYNSLFFNPAYAGSHGYGEGTLLLQYRNQWINFKGAPTTYLAAGELSMAENKIGIGLNIAKETIGVESRFDVVLNTAYRIELDNSYIAGGIRVGYFQFSDDFSLLSIKDPTDVFDKAPYNYGLFTVGFGAYFHKEDMYAGISIPSLATIVLTQKGRGSKTKHIYFHTGIMLGDKDASIRFEPSVLLKFEKAAPLQFTLGANIWFSNNFAIGAHWRNKDAVALSAEFHFLKNYRIAAAYDFTLSDIRKYSDNTLEFLIGYNFNTIPDRERIRNIRHGGRF